VCKCRAPLAAGFASRSPAERRREKLPRRRLCTTKIGDRPEVPMEFAFLRRVMLRWRVKNAQIAARLRAPFRAQRRRRSEIHHTKKILRRMPSASLLTARTRGKTLESRPSDSRGAAFLGGERTPRSVTADEIFACASGREERNRSAFAMSVRRTSALAPSNSEPLLDERVDRLRVGLAARRLHDLSDKPAEHIRLRLRLFHLVGIFGDDLVDELLDR
jgi:hypothetical protein